MQGLGRDRGAVAAALGHRQALRGFSEDSAVTGCLPH